MKPRFRINRSAFDRMCAEGQGMDAGHHKVALDREIAAVVSHAMNSTTVGDLSSLLKLVPGALGKWVSESRTFYTPESSAGQDHRAGIASSRINYYTRNRYPAPLWDKILLANREKILKFLFQLKESPRSWEAILKELGVETTSDARKFGAFVTVVHSSRGKSIGVQLANGYPLLTSRFVNGQSAFDYSMVHGDSGFHAGLRKSVYSDMKRFRRHSGVETDERFTITSAISTTASLSDDVVFYAASMLWKGIKLGGEAIGNIFELAEIA